MTSFVRRPVVKCTSTVLPRETQLIARNLPTTFWHSERETGYSKHGHSLPLGFYSFNLINRTVHAKTGPFICMQIP